MVDHNTFAGNFLSILDNFQTNQPPNQNENHGQDRKTQGHETSTSDECFELKEGDIRPRRCKDQQKYSSAGSRKSEVRQNRINKESLPTGCKRKFVEDSADRSTQNKRSKSHKYKHFKQDIPLNKQKQASETPSKKKADRNFLELGSLNANKEINKRVHGSDSRNYKERPRRAKEKREDFKRNKVGNGENVRSHNKRISCSSIKTKNSSLQKKNTEESEQLIRDSKTFPVNTHKMKGNEFLESLLDSDTSVLLTTLASPRSGFEELVNNRPLGPDLLMLIIKVLDKINKSEAHQLKMHIFSSAFTPEFIDEIKRFLSLLCIEDNQNRLSVVSSFLINLLNVFDTAINILPSIMNEKLKNTLNAMKLSMKSLKDLHAIDVSDKLFEKLEELIDQVMPSMEHTNKMHKEKNINRKDILPPNSFRELPLVPTKEDFITEKCYLRQNIVKGSYKNVDHYLDVQFRLLREDFIAPLREGIYEYIGSLSEPHLKRKYTNVRIYPKVKFENPSKLRGIHGFYILFDCGKKLPRNINWEYNKRFMTGSLLLFSDDNFQTFYLATVVERKVDHLQRGLLFITFVPGTAVPEYLFDPEVFFVMAESEVYYEAYKHVLSALQRMNENNFPMRQYIVDVNNDCSPPAYLMDNSEYDISNFKINLLDDSSWPSYEELNLNQSQYQALKSALTNDFTVVQGPPGTGKTFLALKITEILLENKISDNAPIVVVCYTNHALDQFLEGILKYTKNLVRIGSQSQNEALRNFNLEELRKSRKSRNISHSILYGEKFKKKREIEKELESVKNKIENLNNPEGILDLNSLKSVMAPYQFNEVVGYEVYWLFCVDNPELLAVEECSQHVIPAAEGQMWDNPENFIDAQEDYEFDEEENSRRLADMTEDDFFEEDLLQKGNHTGNLVYCLQYEKIKKLLYEAEYQMVQSQRCNTRESYAKFLSETHIKMNIQEMTQQLHFLEKQLLRFRSFKFNPERFYMFQTANIWTLSLNDRWEYYVALVHLYICQLKQIVQHLTKGYQEISMEMYELRQLEDLLFVRNASVVGLTTSGAARRRVLLENLGTKIVIVEEAAEVLEAHIVTSLAQSVQHVILIGDHKQLKPKPAVFKLAKQYNMDCSLFERMINNGHACSFLNEQHRMRPEIASLICPTIYPNLTNHHSTYNRHNIRGIDKFVFFLTHNRPEDQLPDTSSRQNKYEADLLMALCKYLLLNDYKPEEITILATYTGQVWYMRKKKREMISSFPNMKNVRVSPVDNFQGEENRIILLSLVRSNKESRIGFLSTENRVCVALSRAKEGLYIVGNMDNLTNSSTIWPRIKQSLEAINAIGPKLILRCERHPDQITQVSEEKDFKSLPEGGCTLKCDARLQCGHTCSRICHIIDRDHGFYKCQEKCERSPCSIEGHGCHLRCWETCEPCKIKMRKQLPCGHKTTLRCCEEPAEYKCLEKVAAIHPACGHQVTKSCFLDPEKSECTNPCSTRLTCGHACIKNCHENDDPDHLEFKCVKTCAKVYEGCSRQIHPCPKKCYEECEPCEVMMKTKLPCGHLLKIPCSEDPFKSKCTKTCNKVMTCSHKCKLLCWEPCTPEACTELVDKEAPCGHTFKQIKCNKPIDKYRCTQPCLRKLDCGHACTQMCYKTCSNIRCKQQVDSCVPACGHPPIKIPCYLNKPELQGGSDELVQLCDVPCGKTMNCGHQCSGTCGMCLQGRLHVPCEQRCRKILICGHKCVANCSKLCPPCTSKRCLISCQHMKKYFIKRHKNHPCFERCDPCDKQCMWVCKHYQCLRKCGEECDRPACYEPCPEVLSCGHSCIGFCGEPCPPLCATCNADDPAVKDHPQARYVVLADCTDIIEGKALDFLVVNATQNNIYRLMKCPKCSKPIANTLRCRHVYFGFRKQVIKINDVINEDEVLRLQRINDHHSKLLASRPTSSHTMNTLMNLCSKAIKDNFDKNIGRMILGCLLEPLALKCEEFEKLLKSSTIKSQKHPEKRLKLRLEYVAHALDWRIDHINYETIQQIELVVAQTLRLMSNNEVLNLPLSWYDITPYTWEDDRQLVTKHNIEDSVMKLTPTLRTRDSSKQWSCCQKYHLFVNENEEPCVMCKHEEEEKWHRLVEAEERNLEYIMKASRDRGPKEGQRHDDPRVTDFRYRCVEQKKGRGGNQRNVQKAEYRDDTGLRRERAEVGGIPGWNDTLEPGYVQQQHLRPQQMSHRNLRPGLMLPRWKRLKIRW